MTRRDTADGRDARPALAEVRRRLARLTPRARLEALTEAPDARALVRALPAEDLYATIMDVGLADAPELVQLASPAQFRTFVDLGGWKKDRLEPHAVLTWLRAARGEGGEELLRKVHGLDLEVLELVLRHFTRVHDLEEDPDVNPEGVTLETPEGRYLVEVLAEGAELAGVRALLNDLIAESPFEAVRLLEALRWELPSELEETAYRFRSARLEDLGFPPLEQALALFTSVDPGPRPAGASAPAALATAGGGHLDYLQAAADALSDVERDALEAELREVANAVLVAEAADPGEREAVRRVLEMTRDYLSLGLEHLSGGVPARAAALVDERPLRDIFRVGFSLTLQLKFRADRLLTAPLSRVDDTPLLFPEEAAAVEALRRKRPRRALRVEGAEVVAFRSLREVAASEALLARAEAQVALLGALLGGSEASAATQLARFGVALPALGVERFFAASVALAVLEGRHDPRPVPAGRTVELCERLFEGSPAAPALRPSAAERARATLGPLVAPAHHPELSRLVGLTLGRLLDELAPAYLREGSIDPSLSVVLPMEGRPGP